MIRYALRCACGHAFEAWFNNAAAYDEQERRHLITCPICSGSDVTKAPMAPAIGRSRPSVAPDPAQMRAALMQLNRHVKQHAEAVGERFTEEARAIHRGDAAERPIWGQASPTDASDLRDEGIDVVPLPDVPDHDA